MEAAATCPKCRHDIAEAVFLHIGQWIVGTEYRCKSCWHVWTDYYSDFSDVRPEEIVNNPGPLVEPEIPND